MIDHNCFICKSEASAKGCICNGTVKLIGLKCLVNHINDEEWDHNLLNLNTALRMHSDISLVDFYLSELPNVHEALIYLRCNSNRIKTLKKPLNEDKQKLIYRIEKIFNRIESSIDEKNI